MKTSLLPKVLGQKSGRLSALGMLALFVSAWPGVSADVWTGCLGAVVPGIDPVIVGDGPLVGDAPNDTAVPLVMSCYTGELHDENDVDTYDLAPGWNAVAGGPGGIRIAVIGLEGCFDRTVTITSTGVSSTVRVCEGERKDIAILKQGVHLSFSSGPGTYEFFFE